MPMTLRPTPFVQGIFYVATGLWPIVQLQSFEAVTGPKAETWLVRTLGGLIAVVGATLLTGAFEARASRALRALGIGSAAVLGLADVIYAAQGRISKMYLGDALVEGLLIALWVAPRALLRTV